MNPLNGQWFYRGFRKQIRAELGRQRAEAVWREAGWEYARILTTDPALKRHKGAMTLPAVALYRAITEHGGNAEALLNAYGDHMGRRFAGIVHGITSIPGVSRLIWRHVAGIMDSMSSEKLGYRRRIVSEPPDLYGVDILSCPYHELAKALGNEKARTTAVSEGAECCDYRLRFDRNRK